MDTDCRSNHLPYYTHDTPDALDAHDTNRGGPYPPHPNSMAQNGTDVAAYYSQSSPAEQCGASATSADWYSCIMESAPDTAQSRLHQTLPPPRALSRAESLWSSSAGPSFSGNDNGNAEYALGATGRPIALPDQASPRTLPPESLGSGQERSLVSSGTVDAEIGCLPHTLFGALSSVGAGFPYLQNLSDGTTGASPYFARDVGIDTLSAPEGRTYYYPAGNAFDTSSSAPGAYQDDREDLSLCGGVDVKPDPDDDMASVMHSELDDTEVRTRYRDGMLKTEPSSVAGETPSDAGSIAQDEPYAKLIWRAFKSVPTNSMTLQDLYQWFRENTFKAKGEGKGWQNSIRHNLSMNAAFTKREIPQDSSPAIGTPSPETGKKSTEWFLEPFAYAGVESTTRYRKFNGSKGRRNGGVSSPSSQRHAYRTATSRKAGPTTPKNRRRALSAATGPSRAYLHRDTKSMASFRDGYYDSAVDGLPGSEEPRIPDHDGLGLGPLYHCHIPMVATGYDAFAGVDPQQQHFVTAADAGMSEEGYYHPFPTDTGAFADNAVGSYLGGDEYTAGVCGPTWTGGEQQGCRY